MARAISASDASNITVDGLDCSQLEDGDYSLGCTVSYVTCGNGIKHTRHCPSDLVFDPRVRRCVQPQQCGDAAMEQPVNLAASPTSYVAASPLQPGEFCLCFSSLFEGLQCSSWILFSGPIIDSRHDAVLKEMTVSLGAVLILAWL